MSLLTDGTNYFLQPVAGRRLSSAMAGRRSIAGEFGAWTPIAAEQTASGYEVALSIPAPISTRFGTPTAAAMSLRSHWRGRAERRVGVVSRPVSTMT